MEGDRRFRFLIPPFVLLVSLIWGAYQNYVDLRVVLRDLKLGQELASLITALATGSVVVIALGFLISAASIFVLRLIFVIGSRARSRRIRRDYEAYMSDQALKTLWKRLTDKSLKNDEIPDHKWTLAIEATYEFGVIPDDLIKWILRRWDTFVVSTNCATALALSLYVGWALGLDVKPLWWQPVALFMLILAVNARIAYQQEVDMIDFLADCKQDVIETKRDAKKPKRDTANIPPPAADGI